MLESYNIADMKIPQTAPRKQHPLESNKEIGKIYLIPYFPHFENERDVTAYFILGSVKT